MNNNERQKSRRFALCLKIMCSCAFLGLGIFMTTLMSFETDACKFFEDKIIIMTSVVETIRRRKCCRWKERAQNKLCIELNQIVIDRYIDGLLIIGILLVGYEL